MGESATPEAPDDDHPSRTEQETDGQLTITEQGLELPEWLHGYVGQFRIRTPNITGNLNTTEEGLKEHSETLASVPNAGTYNEDLEEGQLALYATGRKERVYEIIDLREDSE